MTASTSILKRFLFPLAVAVIAPVSAATFAACGSSSPATTNGADASGPGADATTTPDGGGGDGGAGDGASLTDGGGGDAEFTQAAHLPFPALVYGGAPLLLAPKIITITFEGDTLAPQLDSFGAGVTSTTAWWPAVISEYCEPDGGCVGKGPAGTTVAVDGGAPPAVYDPSLGPYDASGAVSITAYIEGLMAKNAVPLPDANTIYSVFLPASVDFNGGGSGCNQGFAGYHGQGTYKGQDYVYAINLECAGTLDDATLTAAHEIAESASDGLSTQTTGGYYVDLNDPNTWGWSDSFDGEIADMCDDYYGLGQDHWTEGSFLYQRIWSVKAAAANKNPCLPIPTGEVYFNAAPQTAFLEMNVGETITIEVDAFSDAPAGAWNILAQDTTDPTGASIYVSLSFSGGTTIDAGAGSAEVTGVNNGSKPKLAITLTQDPSAVYDGVTNFGEADVTLWSYSGSTDIQKATAGHYWPLAVMTRGAATDAGVTFEDGGVPQKHVRAPRWSGPRGGHRTPRGVGVSR